MLLLSSFSQLLHLLDNTAGGILASERSDLGRPKTFRLPTIERPEGCYVRTRGDIMLAVIRKQDMLACDDDRGIQRVKQTARPVCVKVNKLKENLSLI